MTETIDNLGGKTIRIALEKAAREMNKNTIAFRALSSQLEGV